MRGINHRALLQNWDIILHKLCDECSAHDVLGIVVDNLKNDVKKLESLSMSPKKIIDAMDKIVEAMKILDPDQ